ncbi:MAG: hypothetical protein U1E40_03195 [Amaricoccus sp.]
MLAQGFPRVRILNLGRWSNNRAVRDPAIEIVSPAPSARAEALKALASSPEDLLTVIATPPLLTDALSLRAAQAADVVVLDVVSGSDSRGIIESAASWLNRHGGHLLGFVLADLRGFGRSFVAS